MAWLTVSAPWLRVLDSTPRIGLRGSKLAACGTDLRDNFEKTLGGLLSTNQRIEVFMTSGSYVGPAKTSETGRLSIKKLVSKKYGSERL
jgi:hypothetical protein